MSPRRSALHALVWLCLATLLLASGARAAGCCGSAHASGEIVRTERSEAKAAPAPHAASSARHAPCACGDACPSLHGGACPCGCELRPSPGPSDPGPARLPVVPVTWRSLGETESQVLRPILLLRRELRERDCVRRDVRNRALGRAVAPEIERAEPPPVYLWLLVFRD